LDGLLQRVWNFLISKKLAIYLIITLTIVTTVGSLVPQESYSTHTDINNWLDAFSSIAPVIRFLELYHFYNTWWYQAIAVAFGISTMACTIEQIRVQWKRGQPVLLKPEKILQLKNSFELTVPGDKETIYKQVTSFFEKKKYVLYGDKSSFHARHNAWARWGLPFFHVSLVVILFWAIISLGFLSRGVIEVAEGQTVAENHQAYRYLDEGRFFNEGHGNFKITLKKLDVKYTSAGPPQDADASFIFESAKGTVREKVLNKSQEAKFEGFHIYLDKFSFTPLIILKDSSGQWITGNFYNISVKEEDTGQLYQERINIPNTNFLAIVNVYPDLDKKTTYQMFNAYRPVNPGMDIELQDKTNNRVLYKGTIRLGETVKFGDYQLEFPELRRFAQLIVARDPGVAVIFSGFWLSVVSLLAFYLFIPKEVWIHVEEASGGSCRVVLGGRSFRFKSLFAAEFGDYRERLQTLLIKDDDR